MTRCPTCGAPLNRDRYAWDLEARTFTANGVAVRLTKTAAEIMDALWRHRNHSGIPDIARLMEIVYGGRLDGGPEANNTMSVHLRALRRTLRPTGVTVTMNRGRPKQGFRIVPSY